MSSTTEQIRAWRGPAILTFGFRPFFFGATLWAMLAMGLWLVMLWGYHVLPTGFDPVTWHAHEFLYGYLSAVVAGYLLTAVPNWSGHLPVVGWSLGGLFALWIAGRIAVAISLYLPALGVALIDLAMPLTLAAAITREIILGKNWRNLPMLGMLSVMTLGNAVFHWEAAVGGHAGQGYGLRIGLGAVLMMIAVVGGRVVPSFTRNWLVKRRAPARPAPPMQLFDKVALFILLGALLLWVARPGSEVTALALLVAGLLHLARLARWQGARTLPEPLVLVLHAGYAFLPLGALAVAGEIMFPGLVGLGAVQHLWMAGALGLMTLAVMSRTTLAHTGQALRAGRAVTGIYSAVVLAALLRLAAGLWPHASAMIYGLSGLCWILAFGGFVGLYARLLLFARPAKRL